jgi:hypothetical protein
MKGISNAIYVSINKKARNFFKLYTYFRKVKPKGDRQI